MVCAMPCTSATQSLLELTVNAKSYAVLMGIEIMLDCVEGEAFDRYRGKAWLHAELAGYLNPGRPLPSILEGVYELPDAWNRGQTRYQEETAPTDAEWFRD